MLDSSPLSALSLPARGQTISIAQWSWACLAAGHRIYVPEVVDYELRRELLRAGKTASISRLDRLKTTFRYLPITTPAMLRAAQLWAASRRQGIPTGDPKKLDIDVILAAQALTLAVPPHEVVVATANVAHLSRFVAAALWSELAP